MNTYNYFLIFFFPIFISCNEDDLNKELIIESSMSVSVDEVSYTLINENIGGNENCDRLLVSSYFYDENSIYFRLNIRVSTSGDLLHVWYDERDYTSNTPNLIKVFLTPNFNPLRSFSIANFEYDDFSGYLAFDFSGTLFQENFNSVERELVGSVEINQHKTINCEISNRNIRYYSSDLNLFGFFHSGTQFSDNSQLHRFFTNNGFIVELNLAQDLWQTPLGELPFNESSVTNNIHLFEQQGEIIASQTRITSQHEWKQYSTSGTIIIEDKMVENNERVIVGRVNMTASDNGEVIYEIQDLEYRTASLIE